MWIPVCNHWRLNERHYGALQGLNKAETAAQYGEEQVKLWRRSYDIRPPALEVSDPRFPGKDLRYEGLSDQELPRTECLKDTVARFLPYWHEKIVPAILSETGHRRPRQRPAALVKHLDKSAMTIVNLNIPTGMPLLYELDDHLKPIRHEYLGDPEQVRQAIEAVAHQGKAAKVGRPVPDRSSPSERKAG